MMLLTGAGLLVDPESRRAQKVPIASCVRPDLAVFLQFLPSSASSSQQKNVILLPWLGARRCHRNRDAPRRPLACCQRRRSCAPRPFSSSTMSITPPSGVLGVACGGGRVYMHMLSLSVLRSRLWRPGRRAPTPPSRRHRHLLARSWDSLATGEPLACNPPMASSKRGATHLGPRQSVSRRAVRRTGTGRPTVCATPRAVSTCDTHALRPPDKQRDLKRNTHGTKECRCVLDLGPIRRSPMTRR
jgi:hypothetical protein